MKAAVVYGENDIRVVEVPTPRPCAGEVLIRVRGSGICATDVKILGGAGLPAHLPTILGHEVAGTVESVGAGVAGLYPGQRVAVYPIAACGRCFFCARQRYSLCREPFGLAHGADGGFAEYVLVPRQIVRLGGIVDIGAMPFDLAAMIEPVSCCLAAAAQCGTKAGDTVAIVGCGPMGLLHVVVCKAIGARVIALETDDARLAKARDLGADVTLNPDRVDVLEAVRQETDIGADIVIAAVGSVEVVEASLPLVRKGGVFNLFGGTPRGRTMSLDPRWLHYGEIVLTGTFAASLGHFERALTFVREHAEDVAGVISVRCRLEEILEAVQRVQNRTALKSVILFD